VALNSEELKIVSGLRKVLVAELLFGLVALAAGPTLIRQSTLASGLYERAHLKWCPGHMAGSPRQVHIKLPSIDVYDPAGSLVYHGESSDGNVGVLISLPQQIHDLRPSGTHPDLKEALKMAPDFAHLMPAILSNGRYTVLALSSTSQCSKCALQNEAVANLKKRSLQTNINVLELLLD
jgi:hypothetical protein